MTLQKIKQRGTLSKAYDNKKVESNQLEKAISLSRLNDTALQLFSWSNAIPDAQESPQLAQVRFTLTNQKWNFNIKSRKYDLHNSTKILNLV